MRILRCFWESRKVWIAVPTIILTAVVVKWVCPFLNIPPEQATVIAGGMVALAIALIGGIAYEDGTRTVGQRKPPVVLLLFLLPLLAVGCAVPEAVLRAQQFEVVQLDADKTFLDSLYADRDKSNDALLKSLDVAFETTIKGRPTLDAKWVLETYAGHTALQDLIRKRLTTDADAIRTLRENLDERIDLLKRAAALTIKTQLWRSETMALAQELFDRSLKKLPARPTPAPLPAPAPEVKP
jgi:hypothetical protein